MKFIAETFILFLFGFLIVFADNIIKEFSVLPNSNGIEITFITQSEENVQQFIIERSVANNANFQEVVAINAKGQPSKYHYVDEWNWMNKFYMSAVYYRIKIVFKNGSYDYSDIAIAIPRVNEIIRSWGSIKLLFR